MFDAAPLALTAAPLALTAVESAKGYAAAAKSDSTRKAYRSAWAAFVGWCSSRGLDALPAAPEAVAVYLAERADQGSKPASLDLYLAAISEAHRAAGHPSPRESAPVRAVRAGIRRTHGTAQRQAAPATSDALRGMLGALPPGIIGARDAAVLLVGFAAALRRSELIALDVSNVTFTAQGMLVTVRRSKTDQDGAGQTIAVPHGSTSDVCPVRRLRAWIDAAGITAGPIFRAVDRHGNVSRDRLTAQSIALIVKRAAARIGLDEAAFAGHSLRAGLATSAALAGKSDRAIMATTRHRSRTMVDRYVRAADRWRDNAAAGLL